MIANAVLSGHGKWREEGPNVFRERKSGRKRAPSFGWSVRLDDIQPKDCAKMKEAAKLGTREGYRRNRVASLDRVELTEGDDGSYSGKTPGGSRISVYFDEGWCWEETRGDEYVDGEAGFAGIGSCIADMRRKGYEVRVSRRSDVMSRRGKKSTRRRTASHDDFEFYGDEAYMRWYGDFAIECKADRMPDGTWRVVYTLMDPLDTDGVTVLSRLGRFDVDLSGYEYEEEYEEDALRDFMEDNVPPVPQADLDRYSLRDTVGYIMNEYGRVRTIETRKDVADAYMHAYGSLPSDDELDEIVDCINDNYAVHIESKAGGKKMAMRNDIRRKSADMKSLIGKYGDADGYVLISRDGSLGMPRFVKNISQLDALLMDYDTGDEDRLERLSMLENDVEQDGYGECKDPDLVAYAVSYDWSKMTPGTPRKNARRNATRDGVKTSRMDKHDIVKDIVGMFLFKVDDMSDADDKFKDEMKRNDAIDKLSNMFSTSLLRNDPGLLLDTIMAYDEGIIDDVARAVAEDVVDFIRAGKRNDIQAAKTHRNAHASMRRGAGFHSIPREFGGGWIETDEVEPGRWRARGSQGGEYATRAVYGRTEQEAVRKAVKEMQGYPESRDLTLGDVMGAEACRSASRRGTAARRSPAKLRTNRSNASAKSARARRIAAYGRKNRGRRR